ncbi:MAG: hypothetical protein ACE5KT_07770 [Methanosarcinales archaeon]
MPWDDAMDMIANELGLNKAEFVTLIFGNEQFDDVAYAIGIYKTMRMANFERDKVAEILGLKKKESELKG